MNARRLHGWRQTPAEAVALQRRLRGLVAPTARRFRVRAIAGADMAIAAKSGRAFATVVVLAYPSLELLETRTASGPCTFPYVPGLLSFREVPVLLRAFRRVRTPPDVIVCDGQGIAHPRRFGLASHLGVLLDCPTFGCAKSRLCGTHGTVPPERGAAAPLRDGGDTIGMVLRTRSHVRPVFISVGHRISLDFAVELALGAGAGYRLPEPTRLADRTVNALRRAWSATHETS